MNILLILPNIHEKTHNFSSREEDVQVHSSPFMDAVLCEEKQLRKWVGIFQVRIFWVEIFRAGGVFQGEFDGSEFSW